MRRLFLLSLCALAACPTTPPRDSPKDPGGTAPLPGRIEGSLVLPAGFEAFGEVRPEAVSIAATGLPGVQGAPDGSFALAELPPGLYTLTLNADFHETLQVKGIEVLPGKTSGVGPLQLVRGRGTVRGRVLLFGADAASGDHSGTQVIIADHPADQPRATVTNSRGAYELTEVIAGTHRLRASHAPFPDGVLGDLLVPTGGVADAGEITLGEQDGFVSGQVILEGHPAAVDDGTGCAAQDPFFQSVQVRLPAVGSTATPDDCGAFTLRSGVGGLFTLEAGGGAFATTRLEKVAVVPDGSTTPIEGPLRLLLARGDLFGTVSISGGGDVSGVEVRVIGTSGAVTTRSDGSFYLSQVPFGQIPTRQIFAQKIDGTKIYRMSAPQQVSLDPVQPVDVGQLVLSQVGGDFAIYGRVYDRLGAQPGWLESPRLTATRWVALDLEGLNPTGFSEVRRAQDQAQLTSATWLPFAGGRVDCSIATNQVPAQPYCLQLAGPDAVAEVWVEFRAGGGGATYGPFRSTILLDTTPPSAFAGSPAVEVAGGARYLAAGAPLAVRVALAAADASSGVRAMRLWWDATADLSAFDPAGVAVRGYAVRESLTLGGPDGRKHVHAIFYDEAGNPLPDASSGADTALSVAAAHFEDAIDLDTTLPGLTALAVVDAAGAPVTSSTEQAVNLAADGGRDRDGERLTLVVREDNGQAITTSYPEGVAPPGLGYSVSGLVFVLDGRETAHTIRARLVDEAGNESGELTTTVRLDRTPPAQPVAWLTAAGQQAPLSLSRDPALALHLGLSAEVRSVEIGGCGFTTPISFTAAPAPEEVRPCTLDALLDGQKVVTVVALDAAGNRSPMSTLWVELDTTPPQAPSVTLLSSPGANPLAPFPVVRDDRVTWVHAAFGADAPLQMAIEERDGAGALVADTGFFPLAASGFHVLGDLGDGLHTLVFRYRDAAGNVASGSSLDLTLDRSPPLAPGLAVIPPDAVGIATGGQLTVDTAPSGDPTFWKVQVQGGTGCAAFGDPGCEATLDGALFTLDLVADTLNVLRLRVVDMAGNTSSETLLFVLSDQTPPPGPLIASPTAGLVTAATVLQVDLAGAVVDPLPGTLAGFEGHVDADPTCASGGYTTLAGGDHFLFALVPDQAQTICVRAIDGAGNRGPTTSSTLEQDATPPLTPIFVAPSALNADAVFVRLADPTPPGPVASPTLGLLLGGVPFDPGDHFHHFEVQGARITQWTRLPVGCTGACAYDGRSLYEIPIMPDTSSTLRLRAVDVAGNTGAPITLLIQEASSFEILPDAGAGSLCVALSGDDLVFAISSSGGSQDGLYWFDLASQSSGENATRIYTNPTPGQDMGNVDVDQGRVVWEEKNASLNWDVQLGVLGPGFTATAVAATALRETVPRIHGSRVAYHDGARVQVVDVDGGTPPVIPAINATVFDFSDTQFAWVASGVVGVDPGTAPPTTQAVWLRVSGDFVAIDEPAPPLSSAVVWDAATGLEIWRHEAGAVGVGLAPDLLLDNGRIYLGNVANVLGTSYVELRVLDSSGNLLSASRTRAAGPHPVSTSLARVAFVARTGGPARAGLFDASWIVPVYWDQIRQGSPVVSGARLAWLTDQGQVIALERTSGMVEEIAPADGSTRDSLGLDGDLLVWRETSSTGTVNVAWARLGSADRGSLTDCNGAGSCDSASCAPSVSQGHLAFAVSNGGSRDLCSFDTPWVGTPTRYALSRDIREVQVSGTTIAWLDGFTEIRVKPGAGADFCLVGPGAACTFVDTGFKQFFSFDAGGAAWVDVGSSRVRLAHPLVGGPITISAGASLVQTDPTLRGGLVTYTAVPAIGRSEVRRYTLGTGLDARVDIYPSFQDQPSSDGRQIVWRDDRSGTRLVFLSILP